MTDNTSLEPDKVMVFFYNKDTSYAMIYMPFGQTVNVDMKYLHGEKIIAWWYNAKNNEASRIGKFIRQKGMTFTPPTLGFKNDWVLVIDDASKKFGKPGVVLLK